MVQSIFLYNLDFSFTRVYKEIISQLEKQYQLTLFSGEGALALDKAIEGTETDQKVIAHNIKVIEGDVEDNGEYPPELVLETIDLKINRDKDFKGFLFFRYPLKLSLWKKIESRLASTSNIKIPMFLFTFCETKIQFEQKIEGWRLDKAIDHSKKEFYLLDEYDLYTKELIDYFYKDNRLSIINLTNKTHEEIFEEICQVIDNI